MRTRSLADQFHLAHQLAHLSFSNRYTVLAHHEHDASAARRAWLGVNSSFSLKWVSGFLGCMTSLDERLKRLVINVC
ncbi:hypothetical protein D3C77_658450 [compost metagenome]